MSKKNKKTKVEELTKANEKNVNDILSELEAEEALTDDLEIQEAKGDIKLQQEEQKAEEDIKLQQEEQKAEDKQHATSVQQPKVTTTSIEVYRFDQVQTVVGPSKRINNIDYPSTTFINPKDGRRENMPDFFIEAIKASGNQPIQKSMLEEKARHIANAWAKTTGKCEGEAIPKSSRQKLTRFGEKMCLGYRGSPGWLAFMQPYENPESPGRRFFINFSSSDEEPIVATMKTHMYSPNFGQPKAKKKTTRRQAVSVQDEIVANLAKIALDMPEDKRDIFFKGEHGDAVKAKVDDLIALQVAANSEVVKRTNALAVKPKDIDMDAQPKELVLQED